MTCIAASASESARWRAPRARLRCLPIVCTLALAYSAVSEASDGTLATANAVKGIKEVEINVEGYSYAEGGVDKLAVVIESADLVGPNSNSLHSRLDSISTSQSAHTTFMADPATYELLPNETILVLVATVLALVCLTIMLVVIVAVIRYTRRKLEERRALRDVFCADATVETVKHALATYNMPLQMQSLAKTRLHLVEFDVLAKATLAATEGISFSKVTLELRGLSASTSTTQPEEEDDTDDEEDEGRTFYQLITSLETLICHGESVRLELDRISVPSKWKGYMNVEAWQSKLDSAVVALQDRKTSLLKLHRRVVATLAALHEQGAGIDERKLRRLVAALREDTMSPTTEASSNGRGSSSDGEDASADLIASFVELNKQQDLQEKLTAVLDSVPTFAASTINTAASNMLTDGESSSVDSDETCVMVTGHADISASAASTSASARVDRTRRRQLQEFVDTAAKLEVTHLEVVKRAQDLLDDVKYETFSQIATNPDPKAAVEVLANEFISAGATRSDAVLKASGIVANNSNTLTLSNTLRTGFNQMWETNVSIMMDRRRQHAEKEASKRQRIEQKFLYKQQLIRDKMEAKREVERELREYERACREKEEHEALLKATRKARQQFVWQITKLDLFIVLLVMGIVFFDKLVEFEMLKPVCHVNPGSDSLLTSIARWWPSTALSALQCYIAYAARILVLLITCSATLYVIMLISLYTSAFPIVLMAVTAVTMYFLRGRWLNMMFRSPFLMVLVGVNWGALHLLNRSDPTATSRKWAVFLYVGFPLISILLSIIVSITIACDAPHVCVVKASDMTQRSFASMWEGARIAYGL